MNVLVINSGSSSIKYQLFDMGNRTTLAEGLLEQIGEPEGRLTHKTRKAGEGMKKTEKTFPLPDHHEGFKQIRIALRESATIQEGDELYGIGHRVVHGGEAFREPTIINKKVIDAIRRLIPLAPLHNPANLLGIEVTLAHMPDVPQVAVFDTAFHQSIPPHAFHYAIPRDLYDAHHIRRYGFHGTSHGYVAKQAARCLQRSLDSLNLIVLHLGNGASAAAIRGGKSIDTSLGMTPLEGLIMGTRCGDIDPAIIFYLGRKTGKSLEELDRLLNKESGLKGICGANDMREILERVHSGNELAKLAVHMYCYRIKKYIGAYFAVLGNVDALVFTAGIGENNAAIREQACRDLAGLGIEVDPEKNEKKSAKPFEIQSEKSTVKILVIPTDEELEIAEQTVETINKQRSLS